VDHDATGSLIVCGARFVLTDRSGRSWNLAAPRRLLELGTRAGATHAARTGYRHP
jgi:hypothetical protein